MNMDNRTRSLLVFVDWTLVLILFSFLFFRGEGPDEWGVDFNRRFLSAICLALGYIGFYVIQWKARKNLQDERDKLLTLKAGQISMVVVLMYVFIFCISLYTYYEQANLMPVSWLWFLAYSTVCLTYMMNSGIYLLFDRSGVGYGNG